MPMMPVTDSMFLLAESREHPMHVGGLQLFRKPDGAEPDYLRNLRNDLLKAEDIPELFRRRPARPVNSAGYLAWGEDADVDLDYHFRHSALPQPGRVRELLELTSRWHSILLDRHRPLWEIHLVEGMRDGRFAMFSKIHHALMDGVAALRHLQSTLSPDPDDLDCPTQWAQAASVSRPRTPRSPADTLRSSLAQLTGLAPAALKVANEAFHER